ncbi:hypothetical protein AB0K51_19150 [Kitasatospora sp. NPDC049285]|uniref:hypothetical protein n=1 Tax=Kitasatospora sp. NPDC049285 TaxID=3157096 RepID=UPI00344524B0
MSDKPINPTRVEKADEWGSGDQPPPGGGGTPPPPPPSAPPPPPPSGSDDPNGSEHRWYGSGGGGGLAAATIPRQAAPAAVPPVVPSINVVHQHFYGAPAVPVQAPRFSLRRVVTSGTEALRATGGLVLVAVVYKADAGYYEGVWLAAGLAAVGELVARLKNQYVGWLVRVLTYAVVEASVLTPVGRHAVSYLFTGV